jgi:hypothetical protein
VAFNLSSSKEILNTIRSFRGPASNVPCQLPVMFWACKTLPDNIAKAIMHNVNFFIAASLAKPIASITTTLLCHRVTPIAATSSAGLPPDSNYLQPGFGTL